MPIWGFGKKRETKPAGNAAEIERLRAFVGAKTSERNALIRQLRETEAEINVLQADVQREASRAVRAIKEDNLSELLDRHDALQTRASRINHAIKGPAQMIATLEALEVDRQPALSAEQVDRAIAEFEDVMAGRRETEDALEELRRAERLASAPRKVDARPASIPTDQPLTEPQAATKLPEPLRQRLRDAGLLQDE